MILFAYISLACSLILSHPARSLCSCLFFLRVDRRQVCDCRPQSPVVSTSMVRIAGWRWWRWFKLYGLILCATLHGIVHKLVLSVLITTMYGRRSAIVGMCFYVKQKKKDRCSAYRRHQFLAKCLVFCGQRYYLHYV